VVRLVARKEFVTWLKNQPAGSPQPLDADAALRFMRSLPAAPTDDLPPTLKGVRQARRHRIWRISHPYDLAVAFESSAGSRIPTPQSSPSSGATKATIGDLRYDSAIPRAELAVDQRLRTHPPQPPEGQPR